MPEKIRFRDAVDLCVSKPWFAAIDSPETVAVECFAIMHARDPETYTDGELAAIEEACYHALSDRDVEVLGPESFVVSCDRGAYDGD